MKNCEAISEFIALNYKHGGTKISVTIKKMEKYTINVPKIPSDTYRRMYISIWEDKYKEAKSKDETFKENSKNTYGIIIWHCTAEL